MSLVAFQRVFKDNKYFVPSEDSTSLHIHSLLIRQSSDQMCRLVWLYAQSTDNFEGQLLCDGSYDITYGTDK